MNQNKEESKSRALFFKDLENRYSNHESEVKLLKNNSEILPSEITEQTSSNQNKKIKSENLQLEKSEQANFSQDEIKLIKSENLKSLNKQAPSGHNKKSPWR